jgi:excinuclease ABC subunit C
MRDKLGKIIYVGKAASLRARVKHYFRKSTLAKADPKLRGLIRSIADFDCVVVKSETEAILTEGRLIKEYRPRYNVSFRDDKRFLLLRIDLTKPFPRFALCRIRRNDDATYFGPYASAAAVRATLAFIEKRFGLRRCRPSVPGKADHKHCINDIVRYCSAPCIGKVSREEYAARVRPACEFLRGERPEYLKEIRAEMEDASRGLDFERAAVLRDVLTRLSEITRDRAKALSTPAMKREEGRGGVRQLQAALDLKSVPHFIEAYDISNISGSYAVGSMVCSLDGIPQRNRYRRFRIKTVTGIDDPAMMAEIISRSYASRIKDQARLADLVMVDGGITQVRATLRTFEMLSLKSIPVVGLAKKYEVLYVPGSSRPVRLKSGSAALKLLQRLRDEAHRFALDYHRNLRRRRIKESSLDEIAGIGKKRKALLLRHFGSVQRLAKASVEEIVEVPGIGSEMARTIVRAMGGG